jgi:hypothetical protein
MGKVEKTKSPSIFSTHPHSPTSKALIQIEKIINESDNSQKNLTSLDTNVNETIPVDPEDKESHEDWEMVGAKKLNKIRKTKTKVSALNNTQLPQMTHQNIQSEGVHSYFSFGRAEPKIKARSNQHKSQEIPRIKTHHSTLAAIHNNISERHKNSHLPPFKIEFEDQQKPPEIQVLNNLVKYNTRLNVSAATYSKHIESKHVLLLFVNDSTTYELLFKNTSWPDLICNLSFQVILPRRIPPSYSVLVNRIPRDWNTDTIQPLIIERYPSTVHVTRIFRDDQPTNRIRIDFHSQDDVQSIIQNGYIYIDSIRYPATPYKPLTRIDRCYKCQQYGHKLQDCTNEPKCYKCGEIHLYNPNCSNTIICANCTGSHMAGSPQCPVKISYRKEQQQLKQQQQGIRMKNQSTTAAYLPSPARLYSNVLQTMSSNINSNIHTTDNSRPSTSRKPDPSAVIIKTIKDEVGQSQSILLERLIQLEQKYEAATQQQITSQHMIEHQIMPYLMSMSDLLVNIYDTLAESKPIPLTDQQQTKLFQLRQISNIYHMHSSPLSIKSKTSSSPLRPLLSRTRAQPNLYSSLTSPSNQSQLASIPSESTINEKLFTPDISVH